ncbi:glycosyltransferase [Planktotalea sp.]|uniref:glycosyltransferase family 8 protein n=1 Tax=Planktotalea sp. TaxID=2029877 RepID=UPI0032975161
MSEGIQQTVALATVSSSSFLPGTMVLLHSFLQHNSWFDGDLVIIHHDLSDKEQEQLQARFDRVKFIRPRQTLSDNIDRLTRALPNLEAQTAQFHSIEVIGLIEYDRVLFCDSDLLILSSLQTLFSMPQPLLCCGDGSFYRGNPRHTGSFVEMDASASNAGFAHAFNAGFMLMDRSIRTLENLNALIKKLDPAHWQGNATGHTDQLLFNVHFDGLQHLLGAEYNYVLRHRKEILKHSGLDIDDAKVLHFNGAAKPWNPAGMHRLIQRDSALQAAAKLWNDAYKSYLLQR